VIVPGLALDELGLLLPGINQLYEVMELPQSFVVAEGVTVCPIQMVVDATKLTVGLRLTTIVLFVEVKVPHLLVMESETSYVP
jgi:hypothetical protein